MHLADQSKVTYIAFQGTHTHSYQFLLFQHCKIQLVQLTWKKHANRLHSKNWV